MLEAVLEAPVVQHGARPRDGAEGVQGAVLGQQRTAELGIRFIYISCL